MNKTIAKIVVFILVVAAGAAGLKILAQTCPTQKKTFNEDFLTKTKTVPDPNNPNATISIQAYKDYDNSSVANWAPAPIELPRLGANFMMTQPGTLGGMIYNVDSGDFNGDGYPDLIGLDIWRQQKGYTNPQGALVFLQNNYATTHTANFTVNALQLSATHSIGYDTFNSRTAGSAITTGDYNGDGKLDFFYMRDDDDDFTSSANFVAAMYINVGTLTAPLFRPRGQSPSMDFTSRFRTANIYANWAANHLCSVDVDKDGDIDILVASQDKIFLLRNPGAALAGDITKWTISELNYDQRDGFIGDRGGSAISAADFDKDGSIEIVVGTVNHEYKYLAYYENDGQGHFTRMDLAIPAAYATTCVSPVGLATKDFNNDGWPDIFGAGDGVNTGNPPSHMWIMLNKGLVDVVVTGPDGQPETVKQVSWDFKCLNACAPIIPGSNDVDMVTPLDFDKDGDIDIIVADANDSGDYYLVINMLADVFTLQGQAQSTNIGLDGSPALDERLHAVTRIRLVNLTQTWRGKSSDGLKVSLYFSCDGGDNWELYMPDTNGHIGEWIGSDLTTVNNGTDIGWYSFKHFGADLRWRLVLSAPEDSITDPEGKPILGASSDTPSISQIRVEYEFVLRQEYSRASAAATIIKGGQTKKLVIGSSFIFPGWEGQLRAYDVTAMALTGGPYSALSTVTTSDLGSSTGRTLQSGATILWDAGTLLRDRSAGNRTIYTAIRTGKVLTNPLLRTDFVSTNALLVGKGFLSDVQGNDAGLIDFIRGAGQEWKLGDINHSSPIIVGPPSEDPVVMGAGYELFKTANAARTKVLYVGANDGMLHCFDVETGEELWGFIPYNLLPKLTSTWKVATNTTRYYRRDTFVDGSPAVADVQIGGTWKTVLICGQGPGKGSTIDSNFTGGQNYYWALDVTDPTNPHPLWEITNKTASNQATMGETWSVPAIGKVNQSGSYVWMAFMGSGYDNITTPPVPGTTPIGQYFYAVRVDTGQVIRSVRATNINTNNNAVMTTSPPRRPYKYADIPNAIVASPTALDSNNDGILEAVYVGDLDGRLYKMDLEKSNDPTKWTLSALYTDFLYYPIITKPAVWMDPFATSPTARIFFGTGGDEGAPADRQYSFVGLIDNGAAGATVEWYIGDRLVLNLPAGPQAGDKVNGLGAGYKVWADPVISDFVVYFSTLPGSIEAVNPCANLSGAGRLYARIVRPGTVGNPVGGTALKSSGSVPPEYLQMVSKARRAVTVGDTARAGGQNKREVFMQEYNSTIEMLEQPIGSLLQIKSWREVYRVIR
jgi:hypothetical protein